MSLRESFRHPQERGNAHHPKKEGFTSRKMILLMVKQMREADGDGGWSVAAMNREGGRKETRGRSPLCVVVLKSA